MRLQLEEVHRDGKRRVALTREEFGVRGFVRPYVAGQQVEVRFLRKGRVIHRVTKRLRPVNGGRVGSFLTAYRARRAGAIAVRAVHVGTPQLATVRAPAQWLAVLKPDLSSRTMIRVFQKGLAKLRYAVPRSGSFDSGTARAVMAYRKVRGLARTYTATREIVRDVLRGRGEFDVRYPKDGRHVEADLSRQVLALIEGDRVRRIYHISSGSPYTPTVLGRFRVYRKSPGTNANGMVHSTYFIGGYAIHGYHSVPTYNASHGCLRVPIPDAWSIYQWLGMGDVVRVYP
jgi:L,D-transpeptidase catalytic domain